MDLGTIGKTIQQHTDTEVVTAVLSGHTALFEILIRRYNPFLYKIGRSYGFTHHDTEDLMQEVFLNSYVNLGQFANRSSFKTWLIKIMLNQCYHKTQKHSYQKECATEQLPDNSTLMFSGNNHSDNSKAVINREFNKVVEASLQRLPEHYRTTFTLKELTGLSIAEIAELTHTTTSNVKVRLNRAKTLLRKEIEKIYTPEDIYEFNLVYCDRIVDNVMKNIHQIESLRQKKPNL
jgi:RNA polymerase sigma factor (sigma-70 family)